MTIFHDDSALTVFQYKIMLFTIRYDFRLICKAKRFGIDIYKSFSHNKAVKLAVLNSAYDLIFAQ